MASNKQEGTGDAVTKALKNIKIPDDKELATNNCGHCGKTGAVLYCSGCKDAPTPEGASQHTVAYCSGECQKADWETHRKECKRLQQRKALFRAGSLLQKIYFVVRRESFDDCIDKVEEVKGELLIHDGDYDIEPTKIPGGLFRDFPDWVFNNKRDEEACLSLMYCGDSVNHMRKIAGWLLKGIQKNLDEVEVMVTKPIRKARWAGPDWNRQFIHQIMRVELFCGETYAIDLTGAQYGWHEPVTHWGKYTKNCVRTHQIHLDGVNPTTYLAGTFAGSEDPKDSRTERQRAIPVCMEMLKRGFNEAFARRVIEQYPKGSGLLKLSHADFEAAEKNILAMSKQITMKAAEKIDALIPVFDREADNAYKMIIRYPYVDKTEILEPNLKRLDAFYHGRWRRDRDTGELVSVSAERFLVGDDIAEEICDRKRMDIME